MIAHLLPFIVAVAGLAVHPVSTPTPTPDPWWNPIVPADFPPTLPNDRVFVQYLMAPLLEFELGPILKYFDLFHGALAFTNERTNFTFTTNFDSVDLDLFSSQLPTVVKDANGTVTLQWDSQGAVYCYGGVKPNYWEQYKLGVSAGLASRARLIGARAQYVSGAIFNAYLTGYLGTRNATWPYYEMFNIAPTNTNQPPYIASRECFDFVLGSLRYMNKLGATFNGTIHRDVIYIYASQAPTLANYTDPTTRVQIDNFYAVIEGAFSKADSLWDALMVMWEIASDQLYVQHVGNQYYEFDLAWPILDVTYIAEQI